MTSNFYIEVIFIWIYFGIKVFLIARNQYEYSKENNQENQSLKVYE